MKVTFLGTGEAFDPELPNTSVVIESETATILVDCGYSVPQQYFKLIRDPNLIDAFYLTHIHADHSFGIPALLMWMWEEGRTKPLKLLTKQNRVDLLLGFADRGYPSASSRLTFPLEPVVLADAGPTDWDGTTVRTATTLHGAENLAVRLEFAEGTSVMVSGDGEITPASAALFDQCSLVIHESYRIDDHTPGHSSVKEVLETAAARNPDQVALVHTCRKEKHLLPPNSSSAIVPAPGTILDILP